MIKRIVFPISLLLALIIIMMGAPSPAAAAEKPQYYEVRVYQTKSTKQQQRITDYWQTAAVPAYNRLGSHPIGVFTEITDSATNSIYVLIPCDSLKLFGSIPIKLANDTVYQRAAGEFLGASKDDPAYERIESSLLVAFDGMKHLVVPPPERRPNVFELRTYMSPSEVKGMNKIQMFESGEITLMRDIGLDPIFYGRELIGPHMPCLMYMTCGENLDRQNEHWKAFGDAPIWKKLLADPYYKDNMTGMIKVMLKRTSASQI